MDLWQLKCHRVSCWMKISRLGVHINQVKFVLITNIDPFKKNRQ